MEKQAGVELFTRSTKKLLPIPGVREVSQLVDIARPFAIDMKVLKSLLTREFNQYVPFKISVILTVVVFVFSTVLLLLSMFVYHKYNLAELLLPKVVNADYRIIFVKPNVHFPEEHFIALRARDKNWDVAFAFLNMFFLSQRNLSPL